MLKLLPKLGGPYFDFLVFPEGECWIRRGHLKKECFHHPNALRVQDVIVSVFLKAFEQSCSDFNYHGPNEYTGSALHHLKEILAEEITAISSCHAPKKFRAKLTRRFISHCDDDIGEWLPKWRRLRNELEVIGQQILKQIDQAEYEHKALLVLGI